MDPMHSMAQDDPQEKFRQLAQQWITLFTKHPAETGETYLQHLWFTAHMSFRFVMVSIILMTHGVVPFMFTRTASKRIEKIYNIMRERAAKTHTTCEYDI